MSQYTRIPEDQTPFMGKDRSAYENQDEEEQAIVAGTTSAYPPAPAYSGKSILTYTFMSEWNQPTNKMGIMGRTKEVSLSAKGVIHQMIKDNDWLDRKQLIS